MKHTSIKRRVTFWYAAFMTAIVLIALFSQYFTGINTVRNYYRNLLMSTAENVRDGILIRCGMPEIDPHFNAPAETSVTIYSEEDELLYGQHLADVPFANGEIRAIRDYADSPWHIYDTNLRLEGATYHLRCAVQSLPENVLKFVSPENAALMLLTVALASVIGYLITKRAFVPVRHLAEAAESIAEGRDLKLRVPVGETEDELQLLAGVFNDMLGRLDEAFVREQRFTSDASHEMRTPVTAIMTQAEFALSEYAEDEDRRDALVDIQERAKQLSELINRLLSLSRMDSGRQRMTLETADLAELCEIAAEQLTEQAREKHMTLLCESHGPVPLTADQTLITQALLNLIGNAVKYGNPGGTVRIRASAEGDRVQVIVEDDGPGIPQDALPHLFERFYQADASHHSMGSGLGLPLVQLIARMHGGEVRAESTVGVGSRFCLELPVTSARS